MTTKRTDRPSRPAEPKAEAPGHTANPTPPVDLEESVAGEEDPGASLDMIRDESPAPPATHSPTPGKRAARR